jgi:WD40 repeat protein
MPDVLTYSVADADNCRWSLRTARVWDTATGRPLTPPLRHGYPVNQAAFSPDGNRLVTLGFAAATIWDVERGQEIVSLKDSAYVSLAMLSPDGRFLLTNEVLNGQMSLNLTDAVTGQRLQRDIARAVNSAVFSPSGEQFVTGQHEGMARVWDTATGKPRTPLLPHDGPARCVVFSPDGRQVATASEDRTARVWDAFTGQALTPPLRHDGAVTQVAFDPTGGRLVTVCDVQQECPSGKPA